MIIWFLVSALTLKFLACCLTVEAFSHIQDNEVESYAPFQSLPQPITLQDFLAPIKPQYILDIERSWPILKYSRKTQDYLHKVWATLQNENVGFFV